MTSHIRPITAPRFSMPPRVRRAVLTTHIISSVGLLGDSAGFLAVAIRGARADDPEVAAASYDVLEMFSIVFGIPLSVVTLVTGLTLGFGSKWGVLRHAWVTTKLMIVISVMLVGAFVIGPSLVAVEDGSEGAKTTLILAAAYDVAALMIATALSVYKPGRRRSRRAR